jgi:hypothetical protein
LTSKVESAEKQRFKHNPEPVNELPLSDLIEKNKEVTKQKPIRVQTAHKVRENKKVEEKVEVKL